MTNQAPATGQIEPIEFAGKIVAVKRKCSCGGDVVIKKAPEGEGNIATCQTCGATLRFGGSSQQE
jgi:hypothetical protein